MANSGDFLFEFRTETDSVVDVANRVLVLVIPATAIGVIVLGWPGRLVGAEPTGPLGMPGVLGGLLLVLALLAATWVGLRDRTKG